MVGASETDSIGVGSAVATSLEAGVALSIGVATGVGAEVVPLSLPPLINKYALPKSRTTTSRITPLLFLPLFVF